MKEQFDPGDHHIQLPENVIVFPARVWQGPLPPGYSAHEEAVRTVTAKGMGEILDAVRHARGCGCGACYRRAEHTYGWYTGLYKKLHPK